MHTRYSIPTTYAIPHGRIAVQSSLWGITTLFDASRAQCRIDNYREFRARSHAQGLPLVTVELVTGDAPFQLRPEDADILIQRRTRSVLWQKERLLNLALEQLPASSTGVCWIDADVLFEDDDWVTETQQLLSKHVVLQPFSVCIRLPEGGRPEDFPSSEVGRSIPAGDGEGTHVRSVCQHMARWPRRFTGTTGYAWVARRQLLDAVGFYDRCIVGGGDREIAHAAHYQAGKAPAKSRRVRSQRLIADITRWHERVAAVVDGRVGYRQGAIYHLFHGAAAKRSYTDRHAILADHDFDPELDLALDENGCWRVATDKPALIEAVNAYFESRRES